MDGVEDTGMLPTSSWRDVLQRLAPWIGAFTAVTTITTGAIGAGRFIFTTDLDRETQMLYAGFVGVIYTVGIIVTVVVFMLALRQTSPGRIEK